ncbi:hypothetical protein DFJ58DRAFT_909822 [Suillus subalutaceus]|uniref:uncharacterized protein n=1 Tax=Suillus subalutaceus TaxID=48586 RepID=UPI001B87B421|nr:uncharacterized protein DFJ58DRAFT_909822 [Suillus subalutaceus]KAG1876586.1 hypothetical protein DFJ58DRAFT_909822 [Suillus subalutaceus]
MFKESGKECIRVFSDALFASGFEGVNDPLGHPQVAENYQHLLSLSPTTASNFRAINESIMALSLDHLFSIVFDYGVIAGIDSSALSEPVARPLTSEEARVSDVTDERIEARIREVEGRAQTSINNSEAGMLEFGEYGADWISSVARLPPDAYTQLALQLAWCRSRGFLTATYETALTRMFNAGRTGCVHICFLLGLSLEFKSHRSPEKHTHPLFTDPLFSRSQEWKLSTSGLSAGDQFRGTGWEDRYGINYLIAPQRIKFCVESKLSSLLTSTNKFKQHIADAVRDMRVICEAGELELKDRTRKSVDGVGTRVHARF